MQAPDNRDEARRNMKEKLNKRANMLRAQKASADRAKAEYLKKVLGVLLGGGGTFLILGVIGAATKEPAFGIIAILVFTGAVFALQRVTSTDTNKGAGAEAARLTQVLLEIEGQLQELEVPSDEAQSRVAAAIATIQQGGKKDKVAAIKLLGQCGLGDDSAIVALLQATQNSDNSIQIAGIKALGRLAPSEHSVVNGLVSLLRKPGKIALRIEVARTLASIGEPAAVATIPVLLNECAEYGTPLYLPANFRNEAIMLFGHAAIAPAIADAEKDNKSWDALSVMAKFPNLPHSCVPFLIQEYEKKNGFRKQAITLMGCVDTPCPDLVTRLERWLTTEKDTEMCDEIQKTMSMLRKES